MLDAPFYYNIKNMNVLKFKEYIKENKSEIYGGGYVNRYITEITDDADKLPTWFMEVMVKPRQFKIQKVLIDDILNRDADLYEYYISGQQRYDVDETNTENLYKYTTIVDDTVIDGYNRISTLKRNGEKYVYSFVAL